MNNYPNIRLGEIATGTSLRNKSQALPVYAVTKHQGFVLNSEYFKKSTHSKDTSKYKVAKKGHFAYATIHLDEGSIGIAPEDAAISPMYTTFKVDESRVSPDFLVRYLKSENALAQYSILGKGSAERRRSISFKSLQELIVPLPPLDEQRRVASILDIANNEFRALEQLSRELKALERSIIEQILTKESTDFIPLSEIAEIQSGITKGRKLRPGSITSPAPYMAVSNVQDGYLNLNAISEIEVTESERKKFGLQFGDILLTEGGDPDKLGRGAIWREQVDNCIYQNHIFRVRVTNPDFDPEVVMAIASSSASKKYFLRSAKQTTGIASINKTQLSRLPIPILSCESRNQIALIRKEVVRAARAVSSKSTLSMGLYHSLTTRAFAGEL